MAPSEPEKTKDWQLEILMEKLRSKTSQYKTLPEISKNVRMTMLVNESGLIMLQWFNVFFFRIKGML